MLLVFANLIPKNESSKLTIFSTYLVELAWEFVAEMDFECSGHSVEPLIVEYSFYLMENLI
jgi:hypothetical protein